MANLITKSDETFERAKAVIRAAFPGIMGLLSERTGQSFFKKRGLGSGTSTERIHRLDVCLWAYGAGL